MVGQRRQPETIFSLNLRLVPPYNILNGQRSFPNAQFTTNDYPWQIPWNSTI